MESASNQGNSPPPTNTFQQDHSHHTQPYFPAAFEQMSIGIAQATLDGHWLQVNQRLCDITGYTREELLTTTFQAITHPEDLAECLAIMDHLFTGNIPGDMLEKRYIHKKGFPVWINFTVSLVRDENNTPQYFFGIIEDINERKRVETERDKLLLSEQRALEEAELTRRQLIEHQQRLALAQKVGRIGTFEWGPAGDSLVVTPELEALYGLPPGGFSGKTHEDWLQLLHPDDRQQAEKVLQNALASGYPYNTEFRVIHPDGTQHWILAKGEVTAYDAENRPLKMIGINIDVTERVEAEREKDRINQSLQDLNANLEAIVAQRTEVLRQLNIDLQRSNQELQDFAYIASHDLQEPLRKIQAFGNLLEDECGSALGDGKAYLDRMRNAAERMSVLIDDLLTFSRVTTKGQSFTQVDLVAIVCEVIDDLEPRLNATDGRVEVGMLPTIEADPQQMYQLFQNLLVNAVKFHRSGVPPLVKVYAQLAASEDIGAVVLSGPQSHIANGHYHIFIEDNGIGFDEKYLDRIFAVFQRLHGKSEYEGTGVGLAVVRKIVERHGGKITAKSTIGQGTTFIITLPVLQSVEKGTGIL
jgi:PAS domain S-box-containing protein